MWSRRIDEVKIKLYSSVFYGIFFGFVLTIVGSIINNGNIDWSRFPIEFIASTIIGTIMGIIVPGGEISGILTKKLAKPGTFLYKLIFNCILMVIILLYMCPLMTIFFGCILNGASIMTVLPDMFSLAPYFFAICVFLLLFVGEGIMNLAMKLAKDD